MEIGIKGKELLIFRVHSFVSGTVAVGFSYASFLSVLKDSVVLGVIHKKTLIIYILLWQGSAI